MADLSDTDKKILFGENYKEIEKQAQLASGVPLQPDAANNGGINARSFCRRQFSGQRKKEIDPRFRLLISSGEAASS